MNQRPSGYEPDELPDCSTPRYESKKAPTRFELVIRELQSHALPLGYGAIYYIVYVNVSNL